MNRIALSLVVLSFSGVVARAQTAAPAGSFAAGTRVTVQMVDSVYTTSAATLHNATVTSAVNGTNLTVPAGAAAIVKVVANAGTPRTYSLALTSLAVNGQMMAVSGGSPSLSSIGAMTTSASDAVGSAVKGAVNAKGRKAPAPKPAAAKTPSASGTTVYVPAGSDVAFVLAGSAAQSTAAAAAPKTTPATATPTPAAATTPAAPTTPAAASTTPATSSTVVYENVQYQLQSCQREAPHIVCQIQITNQRGTDVKLNGAGGTYYVDQSGNKVNASARSIANCVGNAACQLLPNIAMAGRWEFIDADGHATTLTRLLIAENGKPVAQFTNVPIN